MTVLAALYAVVLFKCWALRRFGNIHRPMLLAMLPLIALDCGLNMLTGGSWRNTLSAEAWRHRSHKWWGWCHRAIDALFFLDPDHCRIQALRESVHGSVWRAWAGEWRGA